MLTYLQVYNIWDLAGFPKRCSLPKIREKHILIPLCKRQKSKRKGRVPEATVCVCLGFSRSRKSSKNTRKWFPPISMSLISIWCRRVIFILSHAALVRIICCKQHDVMAWIIWRFHSIDCLPWRIIKIPMVAELLLNLSNHMTLPCTILYYPSLFHWLMRHLSVTNMVTRCSCLSSSSSVSLFVRLVSPRPVDYHWLFHL